MDSGILIRDDWMVIEHGDKPVGSVHSQCLTIDGGYRYIQDELVMRSIAGGVPYPISRRMDLIVGGDFKAKSGLLSVDINGAEFGSNTVFGAENDGGTLVDFTFTNIYGKVSRSTWKHDAPAYFAQAYADRLIKNGMEESEPDPAAAIWNFETNSLMPVSATLRKASYTYEDREIECYKIELDLRGLKPLELLADTEGKVLWSKDGQSGLTYKGIRQEDMPKFESIADDVLAVPANIAVARPYTATGSTIRVDWQDVPLERFNFEDNRQKLVDHTTGGESGNSHRITLRIDRDERDFTGRITLPVTDDSFAQYLQGDEFIMPDLHQVKELIGDVLQDERDGWKACRKLIGWLCSHIRAELIPQTLTTRQILEEKRGKCSEYAILMAAMARAAGLPIRIALGERYSDGYWYGHMWNEVWLGEWVAVDASVNQHSPDPLLIKLVHSRDVMGTQEVRWGLVGKLGITIDKVNTPEQEASPVKTGIYGQTYVKAEYGCRFTAPDGWVIEETTENNAVMVTVRPADSEIKAVYVVFFSIPQGYPPEQVLDSRIEVIAKTAQGFRLDLKELRSINGKPAVYGRWHTGLKGGPAEEVWENWIQITGDRGFLFVFRGSVGDWDMLTPGFAAIRESFKDSGICL